MQNKSARGSISSAYSALIFDSNSSSPQNALYVGLSNTDITSTNADADLILLGGTSAGSFLSLDKKSTAKASANGWLLRSTGKDITEGTFEVTNVNSASDFSFTLSGESKIEGSITTENNAHLDIKLNEKSLWTLRGRNNNLNETSTFSNLKIQGGSILNAAASGSDGNYTLKGNIENSGGIISLRDGDVGDKLTINGSYSGSNGAAIQMDVHLAIAVLLLIWLSFREMLQERRFFSYPMPEASGRKQQVMEYRSFRLTDLQRKMHLS